MVKITIEGTSKHDALCEIIWFCRVKGLCALSNVIELFNDC